MRNASAWNISHGIHRVCSYHTTRNISEHISTNYAHTYTHKPASSDHREPFSLYFSLHFSLHLSLHLAKPSDYHINSLTSAIGVVGAIEDHPEPTVHDLPPPDPAAIMDGHPGRAAEGVANHILNRKGKRRRKKGEK